MSRDDRLAVLGDLLAVLGNLLGQKPHLPAHFRELGEHLLAQRVESSAKSRNRLDHQLEARAQFLEHHAKLVHRVVRHLNPLPASARASLSDPI